MTYARDLILTLTILAIIYTADNWPKPVKDNQTPFCVISERVIQKDIFGNSSVVWGRGFGPCKLQDIYREI